MDVMSRKKTGDTQQNHFLIGVRPTKDDDLRKALSLAVATIAGKKRFTVRRDVETNRAHKQNK